MKTYIKKVLVILIAIFVLLPFVKGIIHVGDNTINKVEYQVLYDLDYPQTQLNNHTLREVFEDGNLHKINNYLPFGINIINYNPPVIELTKVGTSVNGFAMRSDEIINTENGKKYYFNGRLKGNTSNKVYIDNQSINANSLDLGSLTSNYETYSILYTNINGDNTYLYIGSRYYPDTETLYIKDDYVFIDVLYFGIDNLTVQQIDYWFNIYQTLKTIEGVQ